MPLSRRFTLPFPSIPVVRIMGSTSPRLMLPHKDRILNNVASHPAKRDEHRQHEHDQPTFPSPTFEELATFHARFEM